jgi:hypothetical protein
MTGSFTSGLGSQAGLAAESTYGTVVTPNRFVEYATEGMKLSRAFLTSQGLRAGRMYQSSSRRSPTTRSAAGPLSLEFPAQGGGPILNLFHGATVVPVKQGATSAYLQTHPIGATDPFLKSVTLQIGKPQDNGTVEPFIYPGTVATAVEFSCQTGGFLETNLTLDSQDENNETSLAVASYPSGQHSFNFTQCKITVNGVELTQARGVTLTLNTPKDTGRFYLGSTKKAVPLTNAYNGASLSITQDYGSNTLYELFAAGSIVPVVVSFVGPVIASTFHEELTFTMAAVGLDGDSPVVSGPAVLQQQIPFVVLDDGTDVPVVATYMSTDVTL